MVRAVSPDRKSLFSVYIRTKPMTIFRFGAPVKSGKEIGGGIPPPILGVCLSRFNVLRKKRPYLHQRQSRQHHQRYQPYGL